MQPPISIAHSTGRQAIGTSVSIATTQGVTTSTSDDHISMPPIEVDMHGMCMEDAATITHTPTISVSFTESISVCTTAGTEVTSAAHATVLPASLAIVAWTTGESAITDLTAVAVTSAAIVATEEIIAMVAVKASAAIVTIATEEIIAIVVVGASAAIAAVATEARMATVAVEASTGHKVGAETSVVRAVATAPLVDPTEVVLSAEAAHVAEVHLAAEASTEVDLVAARSVEDLMAVVRSAEDLTAVVMDMVADSEDTVNLTASAHAPQHSSYAVSHSWPCRNTLPEWLC